MGVMEFRVPAISSLAASVAAAGKQQGYRRRRLLLPHATASDEMLSTDASPSVVSDIVTYAGCLNIGD